MSYKTCPNCKKAEMESFYRVENVPVHSVLLMNSKEEALNYPKRDIELGFCPNCGFISNLNFEENAQEYSSRYEETQGFSGTFNKFHHTLAESLVKKHNLYHKKILEIGCGKGEFITLLCEKGNNTGYGFDPAFIPERNPDKNYRVKFIIDYYSEEYSNYKADFICCKMTLEHIPNTLDFVTMVRNAIEEDSRPVVFFQIPETIKNLKNLGFWDIFYEHCSYFSKASLAYLFSTAGFEILNIETTYDDQYLTIEAKPISGGSSTNKMVSYQKDDISKYVEYFRNNINDHLEQWKSLIDSHYKQGKEISLWGGGSKAVSFLTTLGITKEIKYVVDINPYKQGTFLPGNGQEIISPDQLKNHNPELIIVMNPIYMQEIKEDLTKMNIAPELLPVDFSFENKKVNAT